MNKKKVLIVLLFCFVFTVLMGVIVISYLTLNKEEPNINVNVPTVSYPIAVAFAPSSYTVNSTDITQTIGKILITPELRAEFYNTITADYNLVQTSECSSILTNKTFPSLNLQFNNCEWHLSIRQNTGNKLITELPNYFQQAIIFTQKNSRNSVNINLEHPFFWESLPGDTCDTDINKIQKVTEDIYRVENIAGVNTFFDTEYISRKFIVLKGDTNYDSTIAYQTFINATDIYTSEEIDKLFCINNSAFIPVTLELGEQATQIYKQMSNLRVGIELIGGIKLSSNESEFVEKANELLEGFEL